jgi:hypothetical protein
MRKPRLIVFPDYVHSACSFWRAILPLNRIHKDGFIDIEIADWNNTWTSLTKFDIAFFQRPMSAGCLKQIAMAKDLGCKVVIDLDDHNEIPNTHPVYSEYQNLYDETSFMKTMMLADVVFTTNDSLKEHYSTYCNNIVVIPNAIDDSWLKQRKQKNDKSIVIRAGNHHEHDIYYFKDQIIEVMYNHPDWVLQLIGSSPIFLEQEIENYFFVGDLQIRDYFAYILNSKSSIFAIPLIDNEFNRVKSNISWQEATISGAVALTPEWFGLSEESVTYNCKNSFQIGLEKLIIEEETRIEKFNKSIETLKNNYYLSDVNKLRMDVFNNLLK